MPLKQKIIKIQITMTNNKNFHTIMVFTLPKKHPKTNQYNSIVSSHILVNQLKQF